MIKIFKWFSNLLLITVIAILSAYFLLRVTNKIEIYNVKTGSMENKIHVGDYILIFKKSNYNVGDIVTYTSNNGFITHRIIKKDGDKVVTKGDANNTEDETISTKIIIGKVIISGGILNILIKYKYVLSGIALSLYLFSCYFESDKDEELENNTELDNNNIENNLLHIQTKDEKENIKIDEKEINNKNADFLEMKKEVNKKNIQTKDEINKKNIQTKNKVKTNYNKEIKTKIDEK